MTREALRIDFRKKRYGVARWQYEKLDCIDLYMEMLILINCRFIGTCRPGTSLLKWILDTLNRKWDNIRFIELEEAIHLANFLKTIVPKDVVLQHFKIHRTLLKRMIHKARNEKNHKEVLFQNKFFFIEGIGKYIHARDFIFNAISSNIDLYKVNDFKDNLVTD